MGLGPVIGSLNLTIAGQPSDQVYIQLDKAVIRAINLTEQFVRGFKVDIPRATRSLLSSFVIEKHLYWPKYLRFYFTSPYAQYVMQFGRDPGKRPPLEHIITWAHSKGVDIQKARNWWYFHGKEKKTYKSPSGQSLKGWWDRKVQQFKSFFERELRTQLQAAGFDPNLVSLTIQNMEVI